MMAEKSSLSNSEHVGPENDDVRVSLMIGQRNHSYDEYQRITLNEQFTNTSFQFDSDVEASLTPEERERVLQIQFEHSFLFYSYFTGLCGYEIFPKHFISYDIPLYWKLWTMGMWILNFCGIFISLFVICGFFYTNPSTSPRDISLVISYNIGACIQQVLIVIAAYC
jgi:hypothetical protein